MKIGIMTAAFPDLSLDELTTWASQNGFKTLEVACWPAGGGEDRKYGGVVHIDVDSLLIHAGGTVCGSFIQILKKTIFLSSES